MWNQWTNPQQQAAGQPPVQQQQQQYYQQYQQMYGGWPQQQQQPPTPLINPAPAVSAPGSDAVEEKQDADTEAARLQQLQQQAAQWQQQRQWMEYQQSLMQKQYEQMWTQMYQQQSMWTQYQQQQFLQTVSLTELEQQYEQVRQQIQQWQKQFDDWKDQHKEHPNREQFGQYEQQWQQWQQQMKTLQEQQKHYIEIKRNEKQGNTNTSNQSSRKSPGPTGGVPPPPHQLTQNMPDKPQNQNESQNQNQPRGPGPRFEGPRFSGPRNEFHGPPPNEGQRFHGPPPDGFRGPPGPEGRFRGPPPDRFRGPEGQRFRVPGRGGPPRFQGPPPDHMSHGNQNEPRFRGPGQDTRFPGPGRGGHRGGHGPRFGGPRLDAPPYGENEPETEGEYGQRDLPGSKMSTGNAPPRGGGFGRFGPQRPRNDESFPDDNEFDEGFNDPEQGGSFRGRPPPGRPLLGKPNEEDFNEDYNQGDFSGPPREGEGNSGPRFGGPRNDHPYPDEEHQFGDRGPRFRGPRFNAPRPGGPRFGGPPPGDWGRGFRGPRPGGPPFQGMRGPRPGPPSRGPRPGPPFSGEPYHGGPRFGGPRPGMPHQREERFDESQFGPDGREKPFIPQRPADQSQTGQSHDGPGNVTQSSGEKKTPVKPMALMDLKLEAPKGQQKDENKESGKEDAGHPNDRDAASQEQSQTSHNKIPADQSSRNQEGKGPMPGEKPTDRGQNFQPGDSQKPILMHQEQFPGRRGPPPPPPRRDQTWSAQPERHGQQSPPPPPPPRTQNQQQALPHNVNPSNQQVSFSNRQHSLLQKAAAELDHLRNQQEQLQKLEQIQKLTNASRSYMDTEPQNQSFKQGEFREPEQMQHHGDRRGEFHPPPPADMRGNIHPPPPADMRGDIHPPPPGDMRGDIHPPPPRPPPARTYYYDEDRTRELEDLPRKGVQVFDYQNTCTFSKQGGQPVRLSGDGYAEPLPQSSTDYGMVGYTHADEYDWDISMEKRLAWQASQDLERSQDPYYEEEYNKYEKKIEEKRAEFWASMHQVREESAFRTTDTVEEIEYGHGKHAPLGREIEVDIYLRERDQRFSEHKKDFEKILPVQYRDYGHGRGAEVKEDRDPYLSERRERYREEPEQRFSRERSREPEHDRGRERDRSRDWDRERDRRWEKDRDLDRDRDRDRDWSRDRDWDRDRDWSRERDRDRDRERDKDRSRDRDRSRDEYDRDHERNRERDRPSSERDRHTQDSRDQDRSERYRRDDRYDYERSRDRGDSYGSSSKPSSYSPIVQLDRKPYMMSSPVTQKREEATIGETVLVEDILNNPGRASRPKQIVIVFRGPPGSGKTYVSKLVKDRESKMSGSNPRMLCLDDYFMTEVDKTERDPETGRKVTVQILEYEYEAEMEDAYRSSLYKAYKKTIDDGFFDFVLVDAINQKVKHFEQFYTYGKQKGFEVYVAEIKGDAQTCAKKNIHHRTLSEIQKMIDNWEDTPVQYPKLDMRSLIQDDAIAEVEMEDFDEEAERKKEEEAAAKKADSDEKEDDDLVPSKSRWEDASEGKLDKLDGVRYYGKRKREEVVAQRIVDYLQVPDDYNERTGSEPGKKRVRWADIEERKDQEKKRALGFVVGQTDWDKMTDDSYADKALNRTKLI